MMSPDLICSFCGKEPSEVASLVNAVSVNAKGQQTAAAICNKYVEHCVQVIGCRSRSGLSDTASSSPR